MTHMNITQEQYDKDIRVAKAQSIRDALNQIGTMHAGVAGAPYVSATKALLRTIADEVESK